MEKNVIPLEVRDARGNLLGHYIPPSEVRAEFAPFTEAEVNAAIDPNDAGRPLEDILAELQKS